MVQQTKAFQNEFRPKLVKHIVNQISKGETCALCGIPGIGKTNTIYWITQHAASDKKVLLINIDLNNLVTSKELAFYRFLLLELHRAVLSQLTDKKLTNDVNDIYQLYISSNDALLTFDALKRICEIVLNETNLRICLLFDSFEKLSGMNKAVYNSIVALRGLDKTRIAFIFIGNMDLNQVFTPDKAEELNALLNYNIHWLGTLDKDETFKLTNEFSDLLGSEITREIKERIWELSGGHSWYIKVLTKIFNENQIKKDTSIKDISKMFGIKSRGDQIWNSLSKKHRKILQEIVSGNGMNANELPEYLTETNLLKVDKNEIEFFSPLFKVFVEKKVAINSIHKNNFNNKEIGSREKELTIDLKKRVVLKNGKPINKAFSRNEFKLLEYLFKNDSFAITREDIANILWANQANQKYSDWAIDKIISRIREKIEDNPRNPKHLITLRGIGFKFLTINS